MIRYFKTYISYVYKLLESSALDVISRLPFSIRFFIIIAFKYMLSVACIAIYAP